MIKKKKAKKEPPAKAAMEKAEKEGIVSVILGSAVYLTIELLTVFHFNVLKTPLGNGMLAIFSLIITLLPSLFIIDYIYRKKHIKLSYSYGFHIILLAFGFRGLIQLAVFLMNRPG